MNNFRPISMRKGELALLYFPESERHAAVNRLMNWIKECRGLPEALKATGYNTHQRMLSGRQVRIITEHLGEP